MSAQPDGRVAAVSRNEGYAFSKPARDEILLIAGLGVEGDAHAGWTVKHRSRVAADPTQPNLRQVHLIHDELFDELRAAGYDVAAGQLGENVTTSGLDLLALPRGTILRFGRPAPAAAENPGGAENPRAAENPGGAENPRGAENVDPDVLAPVLAAAERATLNGPTAAAVTALAAAARRATAQAAATARATWEGPAADQRATVIVTGLRNPCGQINGFRPGLLSLVRGHNQDGNLVRKAGIMAVVFRGGPIRPGDPVAIELPPAPHLPLEPV